MRSRMVYHVACHLGSMLMNVRLLDTQKKTIL